MILQLGYILHTVPAWKKIYSLRVLVFVEYESEVEEERGRVKALLDKLRIDAKVMVFWLASGNLSTYETIVHGHPSNPETENVVNDCLKNEEWWEELQSYRGGPSTPRPQETVSGRRNPFSTQMVSPDIKERRRHSLVQITDFPKKPTVSQLAKLGVSMGIHTQNLPFDVFSSPDSDLGADSDSDSDSLETMVMDEQFNDADSVSGLEDESAAHPLLATIRRRRSFADVFARGPSPRREKKAKRSCPPTPGSYGTMTADRHRGSDSGVGPATGGGSGSEPPRGILKQERPGLSRHSSAMKFSSHLVPQTTITNEDGAGPRIMFAEAATKTYMERPAFSRQSSFGRGAGDESRGDEAGMDKKVSFAELGSGVTSPARSRRSSMSKVPDNDGDVSLSISGLLASYQLSEDQDSKNGSTYSTQGLPLSFNDIPGRAQHLILNELMRQSSSDTAVMLTTLPIPVENTCQSEEASLAYLSDVEVLCHGLPPVLLVLSNHMTVTVSL